MAKVPSHHPSDDLLLDYASGAQREPVALLIATHLALCPQCRARSDRLEAIGGALLEQIEPAPLADDSFSRLLARLDEPTEPTEPSPPAGPPPPGDAASPPEPLRRYVGNSLDRLSWRRLGSIAEARLLPGFPDFTTRLLRVRPGAAIPAHTHEGSELTLVLAGGFRDQIDHYLRGDVAQADGEVDHRPVADLDEECLCLVVTDAPVRMTGPIGRLFNRITRF
jgi:putative transcriptional regulator